MEVPRFVAVVIKFIKEYLVLQPLLRFGNILSISNPFILLLRRYTLVDKRVFQGHIRHHSLLPLLALAVINRTQFLYLYGNFIGNFTQQLFISSTGSTKQLAAEQSGV